MRNNVKRCAFYAATLLVKKLRLVQSEQKSSRIMTFGFFYVSEMFS